MRTMFTVLLLFTTTLIFAQAADIFQTYIIVNNNGAGNSYYAGDENSDGATQFNGLDFGTHSTSTTLVINGGEIKSYKNNDANVTGAFLYYRVYKQGSSAPSFTELNLPFDSNIGDGGDQKWAEATANIDALSGLTSSGIYEIEVYWRITTSLGDRFDNNSGSNFKATFTANESLPVELTSFTTSTIGNNTELNWTTATEVNNYGFEIESSNDNTNWTNIGFVEGHGNSNSVKEYSFTTTDNASYYRLKQIDTDGGFEYSDVVVVEANHNFKLAQNHPNPFNPTTAISFTIPEVAKVSITIYNALGQAVAELANQEFSAGNHSVNFNASTLTSGIYFYRLESSEFSQTMKMILMK